MLLNHHMHHSGAKVVQRHFLLTYSINNQQLAIGYSYLLIRGSLVQVQVREQRTKPIENQVVTRFQ